MTGGLQNLFNSPMQLVWNNLRDCDLKMFQSRYLKKETKCNLSVNGKVCDYSLWIYTFHDWVTRQNNRLRPLAYPETDVFLICFSLVWFTNIFLINIFLSQYISDPIYFCADIFLSRYISPSSSASHRLDQQASQMWKPSGIRKSDIIVQTHQLSWSAQR